jgi:hypothetical protein
MNIRLVNGAATSYNQTGMYLDLPSNFGFDANTITANISVEENAFKPGGTVTSNKNIQSRSIPIVGKYHSTNSQTANDLISQVHTFCLVNQPLRIYIIGNGVNRYLDNAYYETSTITTLGPFDTYMAISINFTVESPFWRTETLETSTQSGLSDGDTFIITNTNTMNSYPIIAVTANGDLTTFSLKNYSYFGIKTVISNPYFKVNEVITINCGLGTITYFGNSILQYFSGSIIQLVPGVNNFKYNGTGEATVVFSWPLQEIR